MDWFEPPSGALEASHPRVAIPSLRSLSRGGRRVNLHYKTLVMRPHFLREPVSRLSPARVTFFNTCYQLLFPTGLTIQVTRNRNTNLKGGIFWFMHATMLLYLITHSILQELPLHLYLPNPTLRQTIPLLNTKHTVHPSSPPLSKS